MSSSDIRTTSGKRVKTGILIVVTLILVIVTAGFLGLRYYFGMLNFQSATNGDSSGGAVSTPQKEDENLVTSKEVTNILLIGADGDTETNRSDAMMLVSINNSTNSIIMTSFLRDIYLPITGYGEDRLNHSLVYGGTSLLIDTLQDNFGIKIDNYAQVGFSGFERIIDALGGVTMELTDEEVDYLELDPNENNSYNLTGSWALRYARIRYLDSDFGRTNRQRKLVTEIMTEFRSAGVTELNRLLKTILPEITTDMTENDILGMITSWSSYSKYGIQSSNIPVDDSYSFSEERGMSVIKIDFDVNREYLAETIYGS